MEKKTMYNRKLINDWFWYRLEKEQHITKDDLEGAFAQMALYDLKDGGSGKGKKIKKAIQEVKSQVKVYNIQLSAFLEKKLNKIK